MLGLNLISKYIKSDHGLTNISSYVRTRLLLWRDMVEYQSLHVIVHYKVGGFVLSNHVMIYVKYIAVEFLKCIFGNFMCHLVPLYCRKTAYICKTGDSHQKSLDKYHYSTCI